MKKIFSIVMSLLIITSLTSCETLSKEETKERKEFTLAIQKGISSRAYDTAFYFANCVSEISSGVITINITETDDALEAINNEIDFIIASNSEIARANGDYNIFSSPFFFSDMIDCTMTLNSDDFYKLTENKTSSLVKAKPLLALYDGQRCFVSNKVDNLKSIDDWNEKEVAIDDENETLSMMFEYLGCNVNSYGYENNVKLFRSGSISLTECDFSDVQSLPSALLPYNNLTVYYSCHYIYINWIMQNLNSLGKVDDYDMAIINEALGMATSFNEEKINQLENNSKSVIDRFNIDNFKLIQEDYQDLIIGLMQENVRYRNLWDWDLYYSINNIIK